MILLLLIFLLAKVMIGNTQGISFCLESLVVVAIAIIVFFIEQQRSSLKGWWVRPSNILLLGLLAVNLQYIVDLVLGLKTYSFFDTPSTTNYCCAIGSIGVLSFILGNLFLRNTPHTINIVQSSTKSNCLFLSCLQAFSLVGWIMSVDVISLISGATYGNETWGGGLSANLEELFYDSTIAIIVVKVLSGTNRKIMKFSDYFKSLGLLFWSLVSVYLLIRLLSGDRGPFIYTILSIFFSFIFISKRKIAFSKVLISAILLAGLMILVGISRSLSYNIAISDKASIAMQSITKARFSEATVFVPTEELALSFRCNETAVSEIKNGAPYHYGRYQFYAIMNCIPFMPSLMYNYLGIPITELSSDYYLTECYFGDYNISGQIGTSVIAEFYLELGLLGVVLGMFILGLFFKQIDRNICINPSTALGVFAVIITITFASRAIYIPRSNFLSQAKPTFIIGIMFYINKFISKRI